jgi:hypothetical protein
MKQVQTHITQASKEKSSTKQKDTKEASQTKSNALKKNQGITILSKSASNVNVSSVSKAAGKPGYSWVSKDKSAGRQAKSDNYISAAVGNRPKTKSPQKFKKAEANEDKSKLPLKRRDALKDSEVQKVRSLAKNVKKQQQLEVKVSDSSVKATARGREAESSLSKGKEQQVNLLFGFCLIF